MRRARNDGVQLPRVLGTTRPSALYEVEVRALIQAVKRDRGRFPEDFMFQLTRDEAAYLKSQSVTSSSEQGGRRYAPYAFTEQGVAMLSSVLRSPRAVAVNIEIMRAFVHLRQLLATHAELAQKLAELERKYDTQFRVVFDAIRQLMEPVPDPGLGASQSRSFGPAGLRMTPTLKANGQWLTANGLWLTADG